MARKEHPHALTLERFAAGKDGLANAFKKKKQGETRVAAVSQGLLCSLRVWKLLPHYRHEQGTQHTHGLDE